MTRTPLFLILTNVNVVALHYFGITLLAHTHPFDPDINYTHVLSKIFYKTIKNSRKQNIFNYLGQIEGIVWTLGRRVCMITLCFYSKLNVSCVETFLWGHWYVRNRTRMCSGTTSL